MAQTELTELFEPSELPDPVETAPPIDAQPSEIDDGATKPLPMTPRSELAAIRNELTSALHEAHYQRRKRADAVQLLGYERLVRRARVSGGVWLAIAIALGGAGGWAWLQSAEPFDLWWISAASAAVTALVAVVLAVVAWSGPARARQSLSLRQVRRLSPPEMLSEAWFQVAHEVSTPREYRRAFHGLV
jgi:hypothetical protein